MKIKKIFAAAAAMAVAVSTMAINACATDWSKAGPGDENPEQFTMISCDENSITFTAGVDGKAAKCRIAPKDIVAAEDLAKIASATWTFTYDVSDATEIVWLGGGTYFVSANSSTAYAVNPADGSYSGVNLKFEDNAKVAAGSVNDGSEIVFMDWSNSNLVSNGIKLTVSDLKFFDESGAEIAQLPFSAAAAPADTGDSASAPAADSNTASKTTGNVPAAAMVSVMAVAGAAAVASKKRK